MPAGYRTPRRSPPARARGEGPTEGARAAVARRPPLELRQNGGVQELEMRRFAIEVAVIGRQMLDHLGEQVVAALGAGVPDQGVDRRMTRTADESAQPRAQEALGVVGQDDAEARVHEPTESAELRAPDINTFQSRPT